MCVVKGREAVGGGGGWIVRRCDGVQIGKGEGGGDDWGASGKDAAEDVSWAGVAEAKSALLLMDEASEVDADVAEGNEAADSRRCLFGGGSSRGGCGAWRLQIECSGDGWYSAGIKG